MAEGDAPATTEEGFLEKLQRAANELITVTVATVISDVAVELGNRGRLVNAEAPGTNLPAILTNVDLLQGDVTTVIAPTLKDDTALRAYHEAVLARALTVLPNNLEVLARVSKTIFG